MCNNNLGIEIRNLRKKRKMTQQEVADSLGVKQRSYAYYETGERKPKIKTLIRIAEFYNVSLDDLTGRNKSKE